MTCAEMNRPSGAFGSVIVAPLAVSTTTRGIERVAVHPDDGLSVERGRLADVEEPVDPARELLDVGEAAVALGANVGFWRYLFHVCLPFLSVFRRSAQGGERRRIPAAVDRFGLRRVEPQHHEERAVGRRQPVRFALRARARHAGYGE